MIYLLWILAMSIVSNYKKGEVHKLIIKISGVGLTIIITYFIILPLFYNNPLPFLIILCIDGLLEGLYFNNKKAKEAEKVTKVQEQEERRKSQKQAVIERENKTYVLLADIIYFVLCDIAVACGLYPPSSLSAVYYLERVVEEFGILFYQYVAIAKSIVEPLNVTMMSNQRISQKISANECPGLNLKSYAYKGVILQGLLVHEVKNYGDKLVIRVVLVDDNYIRFLNNQDKKDNGFLQENNNYDDEL